MSSINFEKYYADKDQSNDQAVNSNKKPINFEEYYAPIKKPNLKDIFNMAGSKESMAEKMPGLKEVGTGFKESAMSGLRAIPGAEKYLGKQVPASPIPDIEGANISRAIGGIGGSLAAAAPIATGLAAGGEALGLPAVLSAIGGWGTAGALTTPGNAVSRAEGAAINAVPAGLIKGAPYLFRSLASLPYKLAQEGLKARNITKIKPPTELIKDAKKYLSDTKANRDLIKKALNGDVEAIHGLQSDLGSTGSSYANNPFSAAERAHGRAALQTRDAIINHKISELRKMGAGDIADFLEKGRNQYRIYKKLDPWKKAIGTTIATTLAGHYSGIPSKLMRYFQSK